MNARTCPSGAAGEPTTLFSSIESAPETRAEYSDFPFSWGEVDTLFRIGRRFPRSYFRMLEEVRARAREYSDRHIRPNAVEIEQKVARDHQYFSWDLMRDRLPRRHPVPGRLRLHEGLRPGAAAQGHQDLAATFRQPLNGVGGGELVKQ